MITTENINDFEDIIKSTMMNEIRFDDNWTRLIYDKINEEHERRHGKNLDQMSNSFNDMDQFKSMLLCVIEEQLMTNKYFQDCIANAFKESVKREKMKEEFEERL